MVNIPLVRLLLPKNNFKEGFDLITYHFKRSILWKIVLVESALFLFFISVEIDHVMLYGLLMSFFSGLLASYFPDFHYAIEVYDDLFTIHMSNKEKYTFSKSFTIKKYYIGRRILADEKNSVIIPCNNEVLEFLNRIQIKR